MTTPPLKLIISFVVAIIGVTYLAFQSQSKPRVLAVGEVPIAFWSWRTNAPSEVELAEAFGPTRATKLFLRAGQFDFEDGSARRIRPVTGSLPSGVEVHLVYNSTRNFLGEFERLDTSLTAGSIASVFREDLARAKRSRANIRGLQLDFDVPNRLLPTYALLLESLHQSLPPDIQISITGLPAWTTTEDIALALAQVDFWIPQFYGGELPTHATQRIPIASPADVARSTARVRQLGKPFYAGLSAYGYGILYGKDGGLIELRGNIDPSAAAQHSDLELIERRNFDENGGPSETRYEYRASSDLVINGLTIHAGETLMLDIPNSAALRAEAKAVRENAGQLLLGVCMFRLPTGEDKMILNPAEVAAALTDTETTATTSISVFSTKRGLTVRARNAGTASSRLGQGAVMIDITVPAGTLVTVAKLEGFSKFETLCSVGGEKGSVRPCSAARADVLRLVTSSWRADMSASAELQLGVGFPERLTGLVTTYVDDGRIIQQLIDLPITGEK